MRSKLTELLAPAGSYESVIAAINAGADAVYIGGMKFGARAYANNLTQDEMRRAIDFTHIHDRRLYLTVNTLLKEQELEEQLYSYLSPFYEEGLDAVIVQDFGVLQFIREYFPKLPIHASTQMTLTGVLGARMLKEMGAVRIVTARELSLSEIQSIHEAEDLSDLEIESFVHGALCYCYSGQCLLSSMIGGRSGNRGRCAQPCRLPYQTEKKKRCYLLSPKDLCAIDLLPDIIEAGVHSLKIEGRMKRAEYTAGVVRIYRKYLDQYYESGRDKYVVEPQDHQMLFDIYNRGGFTKGYYVERNGKDMMFLEGREEKSSGKKTELFDKIRKEIIEQELKEPLQGKVIIEQGKPAILQANWKDISVTVNGDLVLKAQRQPLQKAHIQKQLMKTGRTNFEFSELEVRTDGESFLPVTALNQLRRQALERIEETWLSRFRRTCQGYNGERAKLHESGQKRNKKRTGEYRIHVYLEKREYLEAFLKIDGIDLIYVPAEVYRAEELPQIAHMAECEGKAIVYVLPHILREEKRNWLKWVLDHLQDSSVQGVMLKNTEELCYAKHIEQKGGLRWYLDHTIYAYNTRAKGFLEKYLCPEFLTLPIEFNNRELEKVADEKSELLVYGYQPLMVSAQCTKKTMGSCERKSGEMMLTDRFQNKFLVKNFCSFCYNRIYNCKPLSLLTQKKEVDRLGVGALRLDFILESVSEAVSVAEKFIAVYKQGAKAEEFKTFTRGHFKRGIE